jgi:hypothetical protein
MSDTHSLIKLPTLRKGVSNIKNRDDIMQSIA